MAESGQVTERGETCLAAIGYMPMQRACLFNSYPHHQPYIVVTTMQASSRPLSQSPSTAAPDRSAILAPPNLAPDDTDWISNAGLVFKVLAGAGELDPSNIAKTIANIALPHQQKCRAITNACETLIIAIISYNIRNWL